MEKFIKEVERLYYHEKLSTRQVAKILNCDFWQVRDCLIKQLQGTRSLKEGCKLRTSNEYSEKIRETQLGEKNNQARLTKFDVINIRQEYEQALKDGAQKSATQYYLARKYGVKRPTISDIVLRRTWKHI